MFGPRGYEREVARCEFLARLAVVGYYAAVPGGGVDDCVSGEGVGWGLFFCGSGEGCGERGEGYVLFAVVVDC